MSWIKAYKGFNKNLQCQPNDDKPPFQYEVGKEYEENDAKLCSCGFHACEFPLDVFEYYPPADSRYCEVELDATEEKKGDSKRTGKKIKIGSEIGIDGIIKAGVKFILKKAESCEKGTGDRSAVANTGEQSTAVNTGEQSTAVNTGYRSTVANTGHCSTVANTGDRSASVNTGEQSTAVNTGYWSTAVNTGYRSTVANTGHCSTVANTGDRSASVNTGEQSTAVNTGYWSVATVSGEESVACALGYKGKAKGAKGCWIVLAEWKDSHRKDVRCFYVDGESVKANVLYTLEDGELVEAD